MHKYKFSGFNQSILHFVTEQEDSLENIWDFIIKNILPSQNSQKNTQDLGDKLQELLDLGAIYLQEKRLEADQKTPTLRIPQGALLRFHLAPRRYPFFWEDLTKNIFYENENYLVFNKPAGVPIHPTVDNEMENLLYQLTQRLPYQVHMIHRLDVETQGLLLLAKSKRAQSLFSEMFSEHRIVKTYQAIISLGSLEPGLKRHWMLNSKLSPKKLFDKEVGDTKLCELEILSVKPLQNFLMKNKFSLSEQQKYFLAQVKLITGRTHQIRAQLSHLGYPIIGDSVYGGEAHSILGLQSVRLEFVDPFTHIPMDIQHSDYLLSLLV